MIPFLIVLLAALLAFALITYNRLVALRNRAAAAWSDIDVQLKRRHDLVGNLVETVRGYAAHESGTLEAVTRARTEAESARGAGRPAEAGAASARLGAGVRALFALAEAYPELKASARFLDLHRALVELEDDLQNARRYYNAVVRDLNTRIQSFPDLVVARPFGFNERAFFELEDRGEAVAPQVEARRLR
ncbi:MAG: LemA family protein [Acidobacteria bacterium]|jgi:LemA protein|nr:LemA family protein [Acidobacteriota bacterium]